METTHSIVESYTVQWVLFARPNFCEASISLSSSNICDYYICDYYICKAILLGTDILDVIKSACAMACEVNSSPGLNHLL